MSGRLTVCFGCLGDGDVMCSNVFCGVVVALGVLLLLSVVRSMLNKAAIRDSRLWLRRRSTAVGCSSSDLLTALRPSLVTIADGVGVVDRS